MRKGKTFAEYTAKHPKRPQAPPAGPSPYGVPGVYEDDAVFILRAMGRAAPSSSAELVSPKEKTPEAPANSHGEAKPKARQTKVERLAARIAKLKADIRRLKK